MSTLNLDILFTNARKHIIYFVISYTKHEEIIILVKHSIRQFKIVLIEYFFEKIYRLNLCEYSSPEILIESDYFSAQP